MPTWITVLVLVTLALFVVAILAVICVGAAIGHSAGLWTIDGERLASLIEGGASEAA